MRKTRLLVGLAVAVAITAAACGNDDDSASDTTAAATETTAAAVETTAAATETTAAAAATETTAAAAAGAQTYAVQVDTKSDQFPMYALAYFPKELTAHPGDTVNFSSVFTGEPHTVTFGTLVDQGIAKMPAPSTDPNAAPPEEPAELKKIPSLLPQGPGDAIQAAAQPCYLDAGDPPASDACPKDKQTQPDFNGKFTYYNSGFLADGDQFTVKLASDLAPGTYTYFCALHRAGMVGKLTVVAADATADTPDAATTRGKQEIDALIAKLKPTADALKTGAVPAVSIPGGQPGQAIAGTGDPAIADAGIPAFGPDPIDVKVGGSVTWTIIGPHTVTFGATEAERTIIQKAPDGSVHLVPAAAAPAGGAGQPAPPASTVAPKPGPPTAIDGGSYDGTGLHSSGLVLSFPPTDWYTYKLTFTKAGSYPYICTVHPDMKGTVNVS